MQGRKKKIKQSLCYFYQDNYPDKNPEMKNTVTNNLDREEGPNGMGTSSLNDTTQM